MGMVKSNLIKFLIIIIILGLVASALFNKEITELTTTVIDDTDVISDTDDNTDDTTEIIIKEDGTKKPKKINKCPEGFTGEFCDEEIWTIDYSSSYDSKFFLENKVFDNFDDALKFSENDQNIIAITKDKEKMKYYPVKKGAKISEKEGFTSFTRPEI